jgi:hypothetical protein
VNSTPSDTDDGMHFAFENGCDTAVSCTIGWTLTCVNKQGRRSVAGARSMRLDKDASSTVYASAAACGKDDWEISEPAYECKPVP